MKCKSLSHFQKPFLKSMMKVGAYIDFADVEPFESDVQLKNRLDHKTGLDVSVESFNVETQTGHLCRQDLSKGFYCRFFGH